VRQFSLVIGAMRGIAAAPASERVEGVRAATVGAAIGQALALAEDGDAALGSPGRRDGRLVIALRSGNGARG
jgi:hypothetical protein